MTDSDAARLHIVCFEEAGDCTLERVARESRDGDAVLVLGPEAWRERLHSFGLSRQVPVTALGRVGGAWLPPRVAAALATIDGDGARRTRLVYGPITWRWMSACATVGAASAVPSCVLASTPTELPPRPLWHEGRRARVRRELGLTRDGIVALLAGDPSEWVDLSYTARALAMIRVGGAHLRFVVSPCAAHIDKARAFLARAVHDESIIVDARADTPWELLPALDAVIVDRDGAIRAPLDCRGWRGADEFAPTTAEAGRVSPLPALWGLACGLPVLAHDSVDLGVHAAHPLLARYDDDVARLARGLDALARGTLAKSVVAASQ